jgi:hypothetical protein
MDAREPSVRKLALEKTAPLGNFAMVERILLDVVMLEIMHIFLTMSINSLGLSLVIYKHVPKLALEIDEICNVSNFLSIKLGI